MTNTAITPNLGALSDPSLIEGTTDSTRKVQTAGRQILKHMDPTSPVYSRWKD